MCRHIIYVVAAMLLPLLLGGSGVESTGAQFIVEILEAAPFASHRPVVRCEASGANFGEDVLAFGYGISAIGCALRTVPADACTADVHIPASNVTGCNNNFAVVPRGNCGFSEKAYYTQEAKPVPYTALIVYQSRGQAPIPMSGSRYADEVKIPVVMVTFDCMQSLMGKYSAEKGYVVTIKATPGYYDLIKYLVPFVAIVGFCFLVLLISLVIRLCRERRRLARKRLSRRNLKKVPTKKYKKGDPEETCAICLDDFVEGDKLRLLPCRHAYHCKCIDPWLTKNRKVCPVCKRKVGPSAGSDSSDSDAERASTSNRSTTRDQASLLRNAQPMATSSTAELAPTPEGNVAGASTSAATGAGGERLMRATSFLNLHNHNLFFSGQGGRYAGSGRSGASEQAPGPSSAADEPALEQGDAEESSGGGPLRRIAASFSRLHGRFAQLLHSGGVLRPGGSNTTLLMDNEYGADEYGQGGDGDSLHSAQRNDTSTGSGSAQTSPAPNGDASSLTTVCSAGHQLQHLVQVEVHNEPQGGGGETPPSDPEPMEAHSERV